MGWGNNPENFQFKSTDTATIQTSNINQVLEFGIYNGVKYERHSVMVEMSSDLTSELSHLRTPEFKEATVYLNVLVEGASTLYLYNDKSITRFFFSLKEYDNEIKPLIYKLYKNSNNGIGANYQYRQQLSNSLDCKNISEKAFSKLEYKQNQLIKLFQDFNKCKGGEQITYNIESSEVKLGFSAIVGLNYGSANILRTPSFPFPDVRMVAVDFGGQFFPKIGMEIELFFPFGGHKWSLFLDPSYQLYKSEKQFIQAISVFEVETISKINYSTIDIPIGLRYFIFMNDTSKLFMNVSVALAIAPNSEVNFETPTALGRISDIEIDGATGYYSIGFGYCYHSKWSLEARYNSKRDFLGNNKYWTSSFDDNFSVLLGYNFL